jgi:transposase
VKRSLRRAQVLAFFAELEPCLIGTEARGSSQYWARKLRELRHDAKLMAPQYVKPYVVEPEQPVSSFRRLIVVAFLS